jgi:predicted HicB family RNase H-like nuclease
MKPGDNYLKIVECSVEDACYVGTCPGFIHGGVHGKNGAKVYEELCQVVSEAVELYQADGKPLPADTANKKYSGRFVLRVESDLHREVSIKAAQIGESLNSYCQEILQNAVHFG